MSVHTYLDGMPLKEGIVQNNGKTRLVWEKQSAGFNLFRFVDRDGNKISIKDDADYLILFMQLAENLFLNTKDRSMSFLGGASIKGEMLYLKPYQESERKQYPYSQVALGEAIDQLPDADRPDSLNFFAEMTYQSHETPGFEKEAQKVAKVLKGETQQDWLTILDRKYDFLKTDLYVYHLVKLYSWGFQAVTAPDSADPKYSLVRPVKPKPRGAPRK